MAVASRDASRAMTALTSVLFNDATSTVHAHVFATESVVTDASCALAAVRIHNVVVLTDTRKVCNTKTRDVIHRNIKSL